MNNKEEYFAPDNIIRLLRDGDKEVELNLRQEYFPLYFKFAKSLVGDSVLVPELVADALSELVKRIRHGYQTTNYTWDWYKLIGQLILERLYPGPNREVPAPGS